MKIPVKMISTTPHFERKIHMSNHDCIRKSIDLKDRNITVDHLFCEEQRIKGKRSSSGPALVFLKFFRTECFQIILLILIYFLCTTSELK